MCIPRSGITGSYSNSMLVFWGNYGYILYMILLKPSSSCDSNNIEWLVWYTEPRYFGNTCLDDMNRWICIKGEYGIVKYLSSFLEDQPSEHEVIFLSFQIQFLFLTVALST